MCKFAEFLEFVIPYPPYFSLSLMLEEAGCVPLLKVRVYRVSRFANISISIPICRVDPPLLGHTINTNLSGAFYATQAAGRQMALEQSPPGGSIIGISSISALVGGGQQTHYTPTKAGVLSLMQSCAVALGKYNIRCNALLPGTIRTQLNDEDMSDPVKREYMEGRIPLGRLGQPPDLAGPAVFLACEELSSYVVSYFFLFFLVFNVAGILGANCVFIDWCAAACGWWGFCKSSVGTRYRWIDGSLCCSF